MSLTMPTSSLKSGKSAMHPSTAEELVEANVPLFKNLLEALPDARIKPKRILLQTGGKNYGCRSRRVRTPLVESDPQPKHLAPNFYLHQEDILEEFCKTRSEIVWNIFYACSCHWPYTVLFDVYIPFVRRVCSCASAQERTFSLGAWYGIDDIRRPADDESKYKTKSFAGSKDAPLGYVPPLTLRLSQPLVMRAEHPSTSKSWEELMKQSDG